MIDELAQTEPGSKAPDRPRRHRARLLDGVVVAVLLALFPVVHDVGGYLRAPYFLDEAWVALSVRFPLRNLPELTSSTPIGWTFLLRLVPDTDYLRAVPLLFHLLTIVGAYGLGRQLGWRSVGLARAGGAVCAAMVLLVPAQQVRHDLKQYSADAALTLILLALTARLEARWSRRRLIALGATVAAGTLFAQVAAVAGMCALGGVLVMALVRRQWRRLAEVAVVGAAAAVGAAIVIGGIAYRSHSEAMVHFWASYFPRPGELPRYVSKRVNDLLPLLGAEHRLVVVPLVVCCALGIAALVLLGRPATAIGLVLLPVAAVLMGVARIYPLFEERTSHFLIVAVAATAGIGMAAAGALAARAVRGERHWLLAAAVSLIVVAGYALANANWYRFDGDDPSVDYRTSMATEDTRSAVAYVKAHDSPQDVIVLSTSAVYGFAFYWQPPDAKLVPWPNTVGWMVSYSSPTVVVAPNATRAADLAGPLKRALDLAAARGSGARVWIIRSHIYPPQAAAWQEALRGYHVAIMTDGVEPVALLSP